MPAIGVAALVVCLGAFARPGGPSQAREFAVAGNDVADRAGRFEIYCRLAADDRCRRMKGALVVRP